MTPYANEKDVYNKIYRKQHKNEHMFTSSLAAIGFRRLSPDLEEDSKLYRWTVRYEQDEAKAAFDILPLRYLPSVESSQLQARVLVDGVKYVLRVIARSSTQGVSLKDYVSIRNLPEGGGVGIYAERDFQKFSTIGWFIGSRVEPTDPVRSSQQRRFIMDDNAGAPVEINVSCIDPTEGGTNYLKEVRNFYMGMQLIRDAAQDGKEEEDAYRKANVIVKSDGSVICLRRVKKDEELLSTPNTNQERGNKKKRPNTYNNNEGSSNARSKTDVGLYI